MLIKSTSGVRGLVAGSVGHALTPHDIVSVVSGFGEWLLQKKQPAKVVLGRDARPSGKVISRLAAATLQALGITVVDLGLTPTPTAAIAVLQENAQGGIVITASHNPAPWNALKLLDHRGEYLRQTAAEAVFKASDRPSYTSVTAEKIGNYFRKHNHVDEHINRILQLKLVRPAVIRSRGFRIAVDGSSSVGGTALPQLLMALGARQVERLHCTPDGLFRRDPEPLAAHLGDLKTVLRTGDYDLGIAVDPDADRLVILDEQGNPWGEDYTLAVAADYILQHDPGDVVASLSSSRVIADVAQKHHRSYWDAPVGEAQVVSKMQQVHAAVGGEGNGGVIYPPLHHGRDALVGTALILSHLALLGQRASELRASYPTYYLHKAKVVLEEPQTAQRLLQQVEHHHRHLPTSTQDGVKITFPQGWVHVRRSNTEPIVRVYAESTDSHACQDLASQVMRAMHADLNASQT